MMPQTLREHLATMKEEAPAWLCKAEELDSLSAASHLLSSRLVFYPGSGFDGGPIACFNTSHAAHCFIYVDYGVKKSTMRCKLDEEGFRGYRRCRRIELESDYLARHDWVRHATSWETRLSPPPPRFAPYAFIDVFERIPAFDERHGADRFAVLFIGADGFATFDALFCQSSSLRAPWCIVLQDHGFGGNYDSFGANGFLEAIAQYAKGPSRFLLVGAHTRPWSNYSLVPNVLSERMSYGNRKLYERANASVTCFASTSG